MRMDVKLGVFFSLAIVLLLGGYFVYPRGGGEAISLTGDIKPAGGGSTSAKLASNSKKAPDRKKSATPARSGRSVRNNTKAKSLVPDRRQSFPKKSSRLVDGATEKHTLPVSGASLGDRATATPQKGVPKRKRAAATARRHLNKPGASASRTTVPRTGSKRDVQRRIASNLTERPGTPAPPGLLAATRARPTSKNEPAVDLHRVQPGDTFATLARAYYGSTGHAEFLMNANPNIDPAKMRIGATIRVPALSAKRTAATTPVSNAVKKTRSLSATTKTYTVRSGDSFYRIAEQQLGDASRWKELFELNRRVVGSDPSRLKIGQVLALPGK